MPANLAAHPQIEQLSDFALGRLESAALDAVESHLATCRECCDTLNQIKEDTFVGIVRQVNAEADKAKVESPALTDLDESKSALAEAGTLAHTPPAHRQSGATEPAAAIFVADIPAALANHARYRIEELIGTGGMGAVYKAEHRMMKRTVALKVINPKFIQSKQAAERFVKEVVAAGRLVHPNIVHSYDSEQAGDVHFLAMEYVKGTDLQKVLEQRGPLPIAEACDYIRQAALGLQHAHENGMVHRDIKPQNLMVTCEEWRVTSKIKEGASLVTRHSSLSTVKILDFGLASLTEAAADDTTQPSTIDNQKSGLTQAGSLMGTPDYMAPEQGRDAHSADIRSDIYSLGCTLYALLSGKVPFPGGAAIDKVISHSTNQPQPIAELRRDVPLALVKLLDKMMAKNPPDRYQTPAEVAAALADLSPLGLGVGGERRSPRRLRVALLSTAATILLGSVIWITTDNGTLKIESNVVGAQIAVSKDGKHVEFIDATTGTSVKRLPSGDYRIRLADDRTNVGIDKNQITIKRWGETVVKITHEPALSEAAKQARIEAATQAAEAWLKLIDAGKFAEAWEQSAQHAKRETAPEVGMTRYAAVAGAMGKLKSRAFYRGDYLPSGPGRPPGDNVGLTYASSFEKVNEAIEIILLIQESDGKWRPVTYQPALRPLEMKVAATSQRDEDLLQGVWKIISVEQAGQTIPMEVMKKSPLFTDYIIRGNDWDAVSPDEKKLQNTFKIIRRADPKEIDVELAFFQGGPDVRGIYKLEGDTFTVCVAEPGQPRPTEFTTKGNPNHILIVARRATAAELGWVELFNGKDLTGWRVPEMKNVWNVEDGLLVGRGIGNNLVNDHEFSENFDLRCEAKISAEHWAQVKMRLAADETGYGMPIRGLYWARGVNGITNSPGMPRPPADVWFDYEISARGPDVKIKINGSVIAHLSGLTVRRGRLALETTWPAPSVTILFRKIQIKELPAAGKGELITSFGPNVRPITKQGVTLDDKSWRLDAKEKRSFELYEIPPIAEECLVMCTAQLKSTGLMGKAYLEAWCTFHGEKFLMPVEANSNYKALTGTTDWATYEFPFHLMKGEQPDKIHIDVVVEGKGTVWIKDVEIRKIAIKAAAPPPFAAQPRELLKFGNRSPVRSLVYAPDGKSLIVGGNDMTVVDVRNGEPLYQHKLQTNTAMQVSLAGDAMAFAVPKRIVVVDLINRKQINESEILSKSSFSFAMALAPNGKTVVYQADGALRLHDFTTGKSAAVVAVGKGFYSLRFSPDGRYLIGQGEKGLLSVLDAKTWIIVHEESIGNAAGLTDLSGDGKRLVALCSRDGKQSFYVFSMTDGKLQLYHKEPDLAGGAANLSLARDGNFLAFAMANGTVQIWDLTQKKVVASWATGVHVAVAFAPDGKSLATGAFDTVKIWDLTPEPLAVPQAKSDKHFILGAWKPVSAEAFGQPVPQALIDLMQPTIIFTPEKLTAKVNLNKMPIPIDMLKKLLMGFDDKEKTLTPKELATVLEKQGVEAVYSIDPTKTPKTINISYLSPVRKTLLGIYSIEGDTLRICVAVEPERAEERPTEFSGKPGHVLGILKRQK